MIFKRNEVVIDITDRWRYRVLSNEDTVKDKYILCEVLAGKGEWIGYNMMVKKDCLKLEKSRYKSHPLTNIFK